MTRFEPLEQRGRDLTVAALLLAAAELVFAAALVGVAFIVRADQPAVFDTDLSAINSLTQAWLIVATLGFVAAIFLDWWFELSDGMLSRLPSIAALVLSCACTMQSVRLVFLQVPTSAVTTMWLIFTALIGVHGVVTLSVQLSRITVGAGGKPVWLLTASAGLMTAGLLITQQSLPLRQ